MIDYLENAKKQFEYYKMLGEKTFEQSRAYSRGGYQSSVGALSVSADLAARRYAQIF